jgi:hypothetical protein
MPENDQPNELAQPAPIKEGKGWSAFARLASFAIVTGGGLMAFAVMTAPTHARGATTSSRLKWQRATQQIPEIETAPESQATAITGAAKWDPICHPSPQK